MNNLIRCYGILLLLSLLLQNALHFLKSVLLLASLQFLAFLLSISFPFCLGACIYVVTVKAGNKTLQRQNTEISKQMFQE